MTWINNKIISIPSCSQTITSLSRMSRGSVWTFLSELTNNYFQVFLAAGSFNKKLSIMLARIDYIVCRHYNTFISTSRKLHVSEYWVGLSPFYSMLTAVMRTYFLYKIQVSHSFIILNLETNRCKSVSLVHF